MRKWIESNSPNGVLICLFELVIGILLLINPVGFTSGIIIAAGIVLIVLGVLNCVKYAKADNVQAAKGQYLTKGLILLIIGGFCVFNTQWFIKTFSALTVLYGVAVLISAVEKIQFCVDLYRQKKSKWYLAAISAAVSFVCALIILKSPFATTTVLWMFTGISLVVEAAFDIVTLITNHRKTADVIDVQGGTVVTVAELAAEASAQMDTPSHDCVTPIPSVDESTLASDSVDTM